MSRPDQHLFYDTIKVSREEQERLLRKAHSICSEWWFDKLDCSESYMRQKVEGVSFEAAMAHFGERALMNVIHRRAFVPLNTPHLEVGFRSMENPVDYFLWIIVPLDRADEITKGLEEK
ncbi:MAG: hypothetical protein ISS31_09675 [Kiritimatiellae bacterium]|nr:hypothetical protein [Kiritimatiellia bacterium]